MWGGGGEGCGYEWVGEDGHEWVGRGVGMSGWGKMGMSGWGRSIGEVGSNPCATSALCPSPPSLLYLSLYLMES